MVGSSGSPAVVRGEPIPSATMTPAMTEPSPQPATGPPPQPGTSRRWFLAGGVAVVLGAGAGVLAEVLSEDEPPALVAPPAALVAAIEAERTLLADLDATTGGGHAVRQAIAQV